LVSPILAELYDLRNDKESKEELINNWFSVENTMRMKEFFDKLDLNKDGFLSIEEIQNF
jgi:serine/threonine-protein phosphatase 2A regulatory subunit B''